VTVGFFLVDTQTLDSMAGYAGARYLLRSVRAAMPGVPVVQLTDDKSPEVAGVDEVRRFPSEPMARLRMRHHAHALGDWLLVDADVVVQRDVRDIFDEAFDIGVTVRDWPHLKPGAGFTAEMPYNMGVVFSRTVVFWAEAYARLRELPKDAQRWMGDQEVFCELVDAARYRIKRVSGTVYNFPPALNGDARPEAARLEAAAAIVHFKGPHRKPLLLRRAGEVVPC
jgi:hypothetical protein